MPRAFMHRIAQIRNDWREEKARQRKKEKEREKKKTIAAITQLQYEMVGILAILAVSVLRSQVQKSDWVCEVFHVERIKRVPHQ